MHVPIINMRLLIFLASVAGINAAAETPAISEIDNDVWWGPADKEDDTSIRKFEVEFDETTIADLVYRLKHHRPFPPPLKDSAFQYGSNSIEIAKAVDYWANEYNFTEREAAFNEFDHYKTMIEGLDIHFMWHQQKEVPANKTVIPLLLVHGWPGSVREFFETWEYLTAAYDDYDFVFDIVAPSLPGFGFSDAAVRAGMGSVEIATSLLKLMLRLGYENFFYQGGDWGALTGANLITKYPKNVLGYHTNMGIALTPSAFGLQSLGSVNPSWIMDPSLISHLYPLNNTLAAVMRESGYFHLQATKPDTIGVALCDSPSALASYILQMVSVGINIDFIQLDDGGLSTFEYYKLIDNLMVYWINNKCTSASRIYAETFNKRNRDMGIHEMPTPVPTYVVQAEHEIFYMTPEMLKTKFVNLVNVKSVDTFGHFLALQAPKLFAELVFEGIHEMREWRKENCDD